MTTPHNDKWYAKETKSLVSMTQPIQDIVIEGKNKTLPGASFKQRLTPKRIQAVIDMVSHTRTSGEFKNEPTLMRTMCHKLISDGDSISFTIDGGPLAGGVSFRISRDRAFTTVTLDYELPLITLGPKLHLGVRPRHRHKKKYMHDYAAVWNYALPHWLRAGVRCVKLYVGAPDEHLSGVDNKIVTIYLQSILPKQRRALAATLDKNAGRCRKLAPVRGDDILMGNRQLVGFRNDSATLTECVQLVEAVEDGNRQQVAETALRVVVMSRGLLSKQWLKDLEHRDKKYSFLQNLQWLATHMAPETRMYIWKELIVMANKNLDKTHQYKVADPFGHGIDDVLVLDRPLPQIESSDEKDEQKIHFDFS